MALETIKAQTDANQRRAADPEASVWVSASAGTGKTSVLIKRLERLLLDGVRPERILCLTYTNAAAAEMQNRLYDDLKRWAVMDRDGLSEILAELQGRAPSDDDLARARQLFTLTLETKGGLKIHTIHGFCERLLHRFPLEAGIAPDFTVLDEILAKDLRRQATDWVLAQAARDPASDIGQALGQVVELAAEPTFRDMLNRLLSHAADRDRGGALDQRQARLAKLLGLGRGAGASDIEDELASVLGDDALKRAVAGLGAGGSSDVGRADLLARVLNCPNRPQRIAFLRQAFLTQKNEPVARVATKAADEADPGLKELLEGARDRFYEEWQRLQAQTLLAANGALDTLVTSIRAAFVAEKASRAALDYDDLIERTAVLLNSSQAAQWVLFKLDNGIDHILVDEAQDTSPLQWQVIKALAGEFFAGEGARDLRRTVFAVGDEKQSIYGFQGAAPDQFAAAGEDFERSVRGAERTWARVPLNLSFRSSPAVLRAVDEVFRGPPASDGVVWHDEVILHHAFRERAHGVVEIWPTVAVERPAAAAPFDPLADDHASADAPSQLATTIAQRIRQWREEKTILASRGRPIEPGDIMILVRKRHPFALPMIRALKDCGIPVAGADRMRLGEQLAVMDLLAFGAAMLTPQDDLSLACVLKSPLIGLDDAELFDVAHGREGSLWEALRSKAKTDNRFASAADLLRDWQARADFTAPYEFFAELLEADHGAMRRALIARIGPDAGDAIDEFLNAALEYDATEPPALQGFLQWMTRADMEIKRDLEQARNEVRVMTVHGAKGLEADIVFLPDTCTVPQAGAGATIIDFEGDRVWVPPGAGGVPAAVTAGQSLQARDREEYHRLLYVAMTRARDRLYICGYEGGRSRREGCWYDLVRGALEPIMVRAGEGVDAVWRLESGDRGDGGDAVPGAPPQAPRARPDWMARDAAGEEPRIVSVTPSSVSRGAEGEESRALQDQPAMSPVALASQAGFARGKLIHKLLQYLPEIDPDRREAAARRYVDLNGTLLPRAERERCVRETVALLEDESFAPLFGRGSLAEVPIVARIKSPSKGPAIEISGQIDRLVVSDRAILIADYKTNRPPPSIPEDAAPAYLAQLAAYRAALASGYPDRIIRCALVWTSAPRLMEIPGILLDDHARRLADAGAGS